MTTSQQATGGDLDVDEDALVTGSCLFHELLLILSISLCGFL